MKILNEQAVVGMMLYDGEETPLYKLSSNEFGFVLNSGYSEKICTQADFITSNLPKQTLLNVIARAIRETFAFNGEVSAVILLQNGYAVLYEDDLLMHIYNAQREEETCIDFDFADFEPEEEGFTL